jgi:hypothetical protein
MSDKEISNFAFVLGQLQAHLGKPVIMQFLYSKNVTPEEYEALIKQMKIIIQKAFYSDKDAP